MVTVATLIVDLSPQLSPGPGTHGDRTWTALPGPADPPNAKTMLSQGCTVGSSKTGPKVKPPTRFCAATEAGKGRMVAWGVVGVRSRRTGGWPVCAWNAHVLTVPLSKGRA